ncbi:MAG: hypothetical protein HKP42_06515 [Maribacter sp.]|nr:hypothetical protein [Maribacter sp.]NNK17616.1 hypothetical protein [Maribacter sp.]NNK75700.1 hypothetical protein [Maribacter sp.]
MKAIALIENLDSNRCKHIIVRNLSKIMDIRILEINLDKRTLSFKYDSIAAIEKVKRELWRIGYPLNQFIKKDPHNELVI